MLDEAGETEIVLSLDIDVSREPSSLLHYNIDVL